MDSKIIFRNLDMDAAGLLRIIELIELINNSSSLIPKHEINELLSIFDSAKHHS